MHQKECSLSNESSPLLASPKQVVAITILRWWRPGCETGCAELVGVHGRHWYAAANQSTSGEL